jgi:hypothetical protein
MKCVEIDFDETKGYPTGESLYYECKLCGSRISTVSIREAGFVSVAICILMLITAEYQ